MPVTAGGYITCNSSPGLADITFNSNSAYFGGGIFNEGASNPED